MKLYTFRVVLLIVVAVDALAILLITTEYIIINDTLVIVFQTTLTDGQGLVSDERGKDETITQITVNAVR